MFCHSGKVKKNQIKLKCTSARPILCRSQPDLFEAPELAAAAAASSLHNQHLLLHHKSLLSPAAMTNVPPPRLVQIPFSSEVLGKNLTRSSFNNRIVKAKWRVGGWDQGARLVRWVTRSGLVCWNRSGMGLSRARSSLFPERRRLHRRQPGASFYNTVVIKLSCMV